jgi:predicted Na+-dependent transporter
LKILSFIEKWMGELLILSILVGYFIPVLSVFKGIVSYILAFLLFSSFLNLEISLHRFFRKELLIFPVLNWVILPVIVYFMCRGLDPDYQIGLMLVIITPPALGSPIIVRLCRGDLEFAVANLTLFNIISPLTYALIPQIFFRNLSEIQSPLSIFSQVAVFIFVPLIIALFVKKLYRVRDFISNRIDPFKGLLQLFMIAVVTASSASKIKAMPLHDSVLIFGITLICSIFLYASAYLLSRKERNMSCTAAIASGHKNTLLSIATGLSNFNPAVTIPTVFYLISHHICNGFIIKLSKKQNGNMELNNRLR